MNLTLVPSTLCILLLIVLSLLPRSALATTPGQRNRIQEVLQSDADKVFLEGDELFKQGTRESLQAALVKYRDAAAKWHLENKRQRESEALSRIAASYYSLDEYAEALRYYTQSLDLCRALGDRSGEAQALNGIGRAYWSMGDMTKALDFYTQSLGPRRAAGNRIGEAFTLGNIGSVYWAIGQGTKSLEFYRQALSIMQAAHARDGQAFILYNLGLVYASRAESSKALQHYNEALALQRLTKDHRSESSTLNNIGLVYASLGDSKRALDYLNEALSIRRAGVYRPGIAITLRNIGDIYARLGETQKALSHYREAIPLSEAVGDRRGKAYTLDSMGVVYWKMRNYERSRFYLEQAVALFREIDHKTGVATALADIGPTYLALGQNREAMERYQEALSLFRQTLDRAGELRTLYEIALLERRTGDFANAYSQIGNALDIAELMRGSLAGQELRASYFATVQDYYDLGIDILMQLHRKNPSKRLDGLALQISERSRARSLLDTLSESNVDIHEGADPQLIQEEQRLLQELNEKRKSRTQLLSDKHDSETVSLLERDIDGLNDEYEEIELRLKQSNSRYTRLTRSPKLGIKEIQEQLVDSNTLLLEYAVGPDRSYVWAVSRASIHSFELPRRDEIDRAVRDFSGALLARNIKPTDEAPQQRAERLAQADSQGVTAALALSHIVLGPVMKQLGKKRLLIVAEGSLQNVPFGALPVSEGTPAGARRRNTGSKLHPLIADHETVSLPSASVLAFLRQEAREKARHRKSLIAFADPVFERTDNRIKTIAVDSSQESVGLNSDRVSASNNKTLSVTHTEVSEENRAPLPRLVFSRDEARNILSVLPAGDGRQAFDFDANRELAISEDMKKYQFIHLATHSRIDILHPQDSGVILSRFTPDGRPQNGVLTLSDIYNLKLAADLVVLSGCETAGGKQIEGEGIIGLTRGFMYAGAQRVVASLWKVDDRATSVLMERFYAAMFRKKLSPSAALREAQLETLRSQNWAHPYYWSAFTIQGEWK